MNRRRYTVAVYFCLVLLAVIMALVGLNYFNSSEPFQGILLGLATEFIGATLIFFIVDWFFHISSDEDTAKQIKYLGDIVERKYYPIVSGQEGTQRFDVTNVFKASKSIWISGRNLVGLLKSSHGYLLDAVSEGAIVRIVMIDVSGVISAYLQEHSPAAHQHYADLFRTGLHFAFDIKKKAETAHLKGKVEIHLTKIVLSYSLILVDRIDQTGIAKITLYPTIFEQNDSDRRSLIIDNSIDRRNFEYFISQFQVLWEHGSYEIPQMLNVTFVQLEANSPKIVKNERLILS